MYYINQQYRTSRRAYARSGLLIIEIIALFFLISRGYSALFIAIKILDISLIAMFYGSSAKKWFSISNPEVLSVQAAMNKPNGDISSPISQKTDIQNDIETELDSEALYTLGLMYDLGQGVKQDYRKAVRLYQKAAEQGHALGQFNLGTMYDLGNGITQSSEQAFYWFQQAAEQGQPDAQYILGMMYYKGNGCEQDIEKALYWNGKAADQGHIKANELRNSKITLSDETIAMFQQTRQLLANNGDAVFQFEFGVMHAKGDGVEQNYEQACYWFQQSANQGHSEAQYFLGMMYASGQGVEQNYKQACYWFQQSADQGFVTAQCTLGIMYAHGYGITQSNNKAVSWFHKAANQGDAEAQYNLAVMYENGRGVTKSDRNAMYWLQKANDQGYSPEKSLLLSK